MDVFGYIHKHCNVPCNLRQLVKMELANICFFNWIRAFESLHRLTNYVFNSLRGNRTAGGSLASTVIDFNDKFYPDNFVIMVIIETNFYENMKETNLGTFFLSFSLIFYRKKCSRNFETLNKYVERKFILFSLRS